MGSYLNNWSKFWLGSCGAVAILLLLNFPAFAEKKLLNITLKAEADQTFSSLMQQAEIAAISLIKQEFNELSKVTEVGITVSGKRNGQEVPMLTTKVSRTNWQTQPTIQLWTNYFTKAAILLGFNAPLQAKFNSSKSSVSSGTTRPSLENDPGFRND